MKHILLALEDKEHAELLEAKRNLTWKEFLKGKIKKEGVANEQKQKSNSVFG